jgi:hypothetical protein
MNLTKRIEALEAVAGKAVAGKMGMIILRKIVAPGTKDEPMNFVTYRGQRFERGSDETEAAFVDRTKMEIMASYGPDKVHLVVGSVKRMDRS